MDFNEKIQRDKGYTSVTKTREISTGYPCISLVINGWDALERERRIIWTVGLSDHR